MQIHVVDHDEMLLLLTVNEKYERSDGRHLLGEQNSEERVNILRVLVWPSLRLIKGGVSRGVKMNMIGETSWTKTSCGSVPTSSQNGESSRLYVENDRSLICMVANGECKVRKSRCITS